MNGNTTAIHKHWPFLTFHSIGDVNVDVINNDIALLATSLHTLTVEIMQ